MIATCDGTLPQTEAEAFEEHYFGCQRCFSELQLRHGVALELAHQSGPKDSAIAPKTRSYAAWVLAAAAVLILSVTGVWVVRQRSAVNSTGSTTALLDSQQKLFEELARIEQVPPYVQATIRGGVGPAQEKFRQGMQLYQQGKYAEAIPFLRSALQSDTELLPGRFYLGISLLMINQTDEAIQILMSLTGSADNPYLEESHWYLAKAFFRKKDIKAGTGHLEAVAGLNGPYAPDAHRLLERVRAAGDERKHGLQQ